MSPIIAFVDKQIGHKRAMEALLYYINLDYKIYVIHPKWYHRLLPFALMHLYKDYYNLFHKNDFAIPPRLIISIGSKTIKPALWLKGKTGAKNIHILSPAAYGNACDMVIRPYHDRVSGGNVHNIYGSFSIWDEPMLTGYYKQFEYLFGQYNRPFLGVLIGGPTRNTPLTMHDAEYLLRAIWRLQASSITLLITISPRTPKNIGRLLSNKLQSLPRIYMWHGAGDNPYGGILSYSDALLVSADSVNMVSEAVQTGKPTYIWNRPEKPNKIQYFIDDLVENDYAYLYDGGDIDFTRKPKKLDNMESLIPKLRKLLANPL